MSTVSTSKKITETDTSTPAGGQATVTKKERDVDITTTSTPTPSQYVSATWQLTATHPSIRLVQFDIIGSFAQAIYLAIHRITNAWDQEVLIETDLEYLRLTPGNSIDVSSSEITLSLPAGAVINPAKPAEGTYMLLCCSMALAQAGTRPKSSASDTAMKPPGGGNSGNGGNGGGGGGNGDPPPGPKPDPNADLNALKALEDEIARINAKLDIARKHGHKAAADHLVGLINILNDKIGQAAIDSANKELSALGKKLPQG
jgi:hypothetical protein